MKNLGEHMRWLLLSFSQYFKTFASMLMLASFSFLGGCSLFSSSTPTSEVGIYLAEDIQDFYGYCPTLEVDIVGLTDAEQKRLLTYDIDKYFQPPEQFRKSLGAVTAKFSEESMTAKILDSGDPVWEKWKDKGVSHLGFIVNLPTVSDIKESATDPRKLIIDINKSGGFMRPSSHNIIVSGSGIIEVKNAPKSAKREPLRSKEAVDEELKKANTKK